MGDRTEDGHPNARLWKLYDNMEICLAGAEEASGISGCGIQTCDEYNFMALTTYLSFSAFTSMIAGLGIAVVVIFLVTNMNVRLTAVASVTLYTIISFVFAEMVVFGWSINLLEAVDIAIAGGMSVDYLLHLVHSYNHQTGETQDRMRKALEEMGVSVTAGGLTTFVACIALLLCDMLWFKLFGCFIIMVICSAFACSMLGLMALLASCGAANNPHPHQVNGEIAPTSPGRESSLDRESGVEMREAVDDQVMAFQAHTTPIEGKSQSL